MTERYIFHLCIPVSDLEGANRLYTGVLGGKVGRRNEHWLDVLLWGHQITLQLRPAEVLPLESQGKRHFGVTLPCNDWEVLAARISASGIPFVEVKTYRNPAATIGRDDPPYGY